MKQNDLIVAPSLLAADFLRLSEELDSLEKLGSQWLHLDVMDGSFVPPISFGASIIKTLRAETELFFDTHLMVQEPIRHIKDFVEAGSQRLTVHLEACTDVAATIGAIKQAGVLAGLAIKPETEVESLYDFLDQVDLLLIMTVNPGWGGQKLIEGCLEKVSKLNKFLSDSNISRWIEVDGGVNPQTKAKCIASGANVLVAGSAIFGATDRRLALAELSS